MFARVKGFVSRHWRKVAIAGVAVEGAYLLLRYAERRLQEENLKRVKATLENGRRTQHYESTERTCGTAITSLFPAMKDQINKTLDCDSLTTLLRNKAPNKIELWEELKILAFSRATALVYCGAMLTTLLRAQLSIISGTMYRTTVLNSKKDQTECTKDIQRAYLSSCQHFFSNGIVEVCKLIETEVVQAVGSIPLKQYLTLQDLEQVFWGIQTRMNHVAQESSPIHAASKYLIGDLADSEEDDLILNTVDVLESEETKGLLQSTVSRGINHLMDIMADYFANAAKTIPPVPANVTVATIESPGQTKEELNSTETSPKSLHAGTNTVDNMWVNIVHKDGSALGRDGFVNPNHVSVPLAKLIPQVSGLLHTGSNSWMNHLVIMESLKVFGANIYEAFIQEE